MRHIMHLLDVVDQVRDHVALGLMSDPGLSKTSQVKQWAEDNGRQYCELIISQRMPSEISGMPMPIPEKQTMEVFDFETLLHLKDGDVLAFDEFTNGNIQTLNACLTLIQERVMLSGTPLPSLVIVAMGNPQGRCDLLPQTKQRFWWVDVVWDPGTWKGYMERTWGFTPSSKIIELITDQYREGFADTQKYNYMTPRTAENLYRIAMSIPLEDPFWSACDLNHRTVEALYHSMQNRDEFVDVQKQLIDWVKSRTLDPTKPAAKWHGVVTERLLACTTMGELRYCVEAIEREGIAREFIAWMKETGELE